MASVVVARGIEGVENCWLLKGEKGDGEEEKKGNLNKRKVDK